MWYRVIVACLCFTFLGCVEPYKPKTTDKPPVDDNNIIIQECTPGQALETYKKNVALNFYQLAVRSAKGEFKYVSELIDASKALDTNNKKTSLQPINKIVADALGSGELDKTKAVKVLVDIAKSIDPTIISNITVPDEPTLGPVAPIDNSKTIINNAKKPAPATKPKGSGSAGTKAVRLSGKQILAKCVDCQHVGVRGHDFKSHLYEHGFTPDQVNGLNQKQCSLIHNNVHAGYVSPVMMIEVK